MAFVLALSQAPHASAYNGGSSGTSRQYWLRPTQRTHNGPRIPASVAGIAPGEFRPVWVDSSGFVFRVRSPENGALTYDTLDWTPRAAFDQATQQIVIGGKRIKFKVIAYSDLTGDWRELPMPLANGASRASETGHWYGNTDEDSSGGVYLGFGSRHFRLNPASEAYTTLPNHEVTNGFNGAMYAWSPNLFTQGGLVRYAGDAERWLRYNPANDTWDRPSQNIGNDMHALLEYQATCDRFLLVGGSATPNMARLVTRDGVHTLVTSAPDPLNFSSGSWIVAHPSGCWLVTTFGGTRKLWAVWPNAGRTDVTWQDLGTAPDAALNLPTAAWDGVRGLIYIVATTGIYAYRPPELVNPLGSVNVVDAGDVVMVTGRAGSVGSVAVVDAGDLVAVTGQSTQPVQGAVAVVDAGDVVAVVGRAPVAGSVQVVDAGDIVQVFGPMTEVTTPPSRRLRILADDRRLDIKR